MSNTVRLSIYALRYVESLRYPTYFALSVQCFVCPPFFFGHTLPYLRRIALFSSFIGIAIRQESNSTYPLAVEVGLIAGIFVAQYIAILAVIAARNDTPPDTWGPIWWPVVLAGQLFTNLGRFLGNMSMRLILSAFMLAFTFLPSMQDATILREYRIVCDGVRSLCFLHTALTPPPPPPDTQKHYVVVVFLSLMVVIATTSIPYLDIWPNAEYTFTKAAGLVVVVGILHYVAMIGAVGLRSTAPMSSWGSIWPWPALILRLHAMSFGLPVAAVAFAFLFLTILPTFMLASASSPSLCWLVDAVRFGSFLTLLYAKEKSQRNQALLTYFTAVLAIFTTAITTFAWDGHHEQSTVIIMLGLAAIGVAQYMAMLGAIMARNHLPMDVAVGATLLAGPEMLEEAAIVSTIASSVVAAVLDYIVMVAAVATRLPQHLRRLCVQVFPSLISCLIYMPRRPIVLSTTRPPPPLPTTRPPPPLPTTRTLPPPPPASKPYTKASDHPTDDCEVTREMTATTQEEMATTKEVKSMG
ncbi:hypothetical protein B0H16DRAFT_1531658 [Mycena metata]|uniref:Uncharacterized protein n=1 Tax=Mycena metata TaxID=1033252 RepID=A0AAD7NHB9_9AGAR|nr:hypothetical protein B0H16DRAFT_1531658 [Mycena metata]